MSDDQITEILTNHGKQFCSLLRFETTETRGRFKLTDDKWSWSLYVTLDDMQTNESESPLEWIRITFTRFNGFLQSIRSSIEKDKK
ncbi:MAG: hypothetical protein ACFFDV_07225 [Candidatus Thorarchaeota archaeon]